MTQAPEPSDQAGESGHFWRPTTRLNAIVERVLHHFPPRQLQQRDLEPFHARTQQSLLALGADAEAVSAVKDRTKWVISPEQAPSDAWGGEVLRNGAAPPHVVMYCDSLLTRVPSRRFYRIASQLTVDHMYGHLYEYHRGSADWGEEVACRWQVRLLRQRGGAQNRMLARVVAVTHRFHKQIPLSNY